MAGNAGSGGLGGTAWWEGQEGLGGEVSQHKGGTQTDRMLGQSTQPGNFPITSVLGR